MTDTPAPIAEAALAALLSCLGDTLALAAKVRGARWNARGPQAPTVRAMCARQGRELAEAADALADHIAALGAEAPSTLGRVLALTTIGESHGTRDRTLVRVLRDDHRSLAESCREAAVDVVDHAPTLSLLGTRAAIHAEAAEVLDRLLATNGSAVHTVPSLV